MTQPAAAHIREILKVQLPAELYAHTLATTEYALELGRMFGCAEDELARIELGALLHDNCKHWSAEQLHIAAHELGYTPDALELTVPALLHARIAAHRLWRDFSISDPDIYASVYFHTTGGPGMCRAARIVYCADKLEDTREFAGVRELRAKACEGLPALCMAVIAAGLEYLRQNRRLIHPATIEFYNELVLELAGIG
jgi:predicted HD superfamily hydrolase involved in NAD metabolism